LRLYRRLEVLDGSIVLSLVDRDVAEHDQGPGQLGVFLKRRTRVLEASRTFPLASWICARARLAGQSSGSRTESPHNTSPHRPGGPAPPQLSRDQVGLEVIGVRPQGVLHEL